MDEPEEGVVVKPSKKAKVEANEPKLETSLEKAQPITTSKKPSKVKGMQPRSPPKPKKTVKPKTMVLDSDESEDDAGTSAAVPVETKKRSPRRAAKTPAKYVEISSEGDWNGGEDEDESFALED